MRSLLAAAAAATLVVACGGGDTRRLAPATASPTRSVAAASPTQPFNLDDMMGFYPQQTVFVADVNGVSAVTLLNHFTRYAIPTRGKAEVASDTTTASSLYVLDGIEAGTAHVEGATIRLRAFDLQTGIERASRGDIATVASPHRAMATAGDGRVLVLKADARHAWIDAYERLTLKPLGAVMEKPGCGDRLLVSPSLVAIVCLASGEIAVDALRGTGTTMIDPPTPGLAGAAIAQDGTIYAVTADRHMATVAPGVTFFSPVQWPTAWTGTVLPDGIAVVTGAESAVIAQTDTEGSWLRVLATRVLAPRASMRLAGRLTGAPQFGILALYPFAYFASGGSVRHVEIESGMLETMTELGQGATIAAVVDR